MTCTDCGQPTLSDGVCVDCSDKRFHSYPDLKNRLDDALKMISAKEGEIIELKSKIKHHIEVRAGETVYAVWRRELLEMIEIPKLTEVVN